MATKVEALITITLSDKLANRTQHIHSMYIIRIAANVCKIALALLQAIIEQIKIAFEIWNNYFVLLGKKAIING